MIATEWNWGDYKGSGPVLLLWKAQAEMEDMPWDERLQLVEGYDLETVDWEEVEGWMDVPEPVQAIMDLPAAILEMNRVAKTGLAGPDTEKAIAVVLRSHLSDAEAHEKYPGQEVYGVSGFKVGEDKDHA